MPLSPGARLGPYEILSPIGAGGMGEVYRARDTRLGRDIAIKVLIGTFSRDADRIRRFEQEARAAGLLNHPNITAVYDVGQHEGAPYVVQELLEGQTLKAVLRQGRPSPRRAVDYAVQIALGLAAAHEKGIVHRDLKPANVFVTNDGRVKILDFGLAKLLRPEVLDVPSDLPTASPGTESGVLLGTVGYMSPEQLRSQPAEERSDIFSLGVVLHEMLSGSPPFLRSAPLDTMLAILSEDPPALRSPEIPRSLEQIVNRCLEKTVDLRFQHARDVAFALESVGVAEVADRASVNPSRWLFVVAGAVAVLAGAVLVQRAKRPVAAPAVAASGPGAPPRLIASPPPLSPSSAAAPAGGAVSPSARAESTSVRRPERTRRPPEPASYLVTPIVPSATLQPASAPSPEAPTPESNRLVAAEPTLGPVSNDSDLIQETLREYERALNTLDVDRYVRIFPSFAGGRRREIETSWRGLKSQHVELEIHQVEPRGDQAVVRARHLLVGIPLVGAEQRDVRDVVFFLEKRSGSWIIASVR
jgi:serine/threonine protein kinase